MQRRRRSRRGRHRPRGAKVRIRIRSRHHSAIPNQAIPVWPCVLWPAASCATDSQHVWRRGRRGRGTNRGRWGEKGSGAGSSCVIHLDSSCLSLCLVASCFMRYRFPPSTEEEWGALAEKKEQEREVAVFSTGTVPACPSVSWPAALCVTHQ